MMYDPNEPLSDSTPESTNDPYATDPSAQTAAPRPTLPERPYRTTQTMPYQPAVRRRSGRQNLLGGCMAIGGAIFAFGVVALIVTAILFPPWYRAQRPEMQEIWCNRFTKVGMEFVCDLKPTPPFTFIPTPVGTPLPQDALDLLLTPQASATSSDSSSGTGAAGIGGGSTVSTPPTSTEQAAVPTSTPTPRPSATSVPATATPPATLTPTPIPVPPTYRLNVNNLRYQAQTWNNCSGATVSMGLSYFGYWQDQQTAASYLKPNREDKNVSPYQMVDFINNQTSLYMPSPVRGLYRVGGDITLLKRLIANEFPVIIEKGYDVGDLDWMGHYLLLAGYDDASQTFYAYDSYLGAGRNETYSDTEYFWRHFNYLFVVIYPPEREAALLQLLGSHANPTTAINLARDRAAQQIQANQQDNWAWFNLADAYTLLGNYEQAAQAFDQAFALGMPWRMLWYVHTPYKAYFAMGRYDDILAHARATESTTPYVEELFYYRGAVYAMQGNTEGAIAEFNKALTQNSNFEPARQAILAVQGGTFNREMVLSVGIGLSG